MPEETLRENKMGTMPENKLLLSMAVPMMISMLVQALYNIVDSIFVSRICEDALTAVSMAFPWQNIVIAIAVGFGVGINALLSRALGQKNAERVNQVAVNGLLLAGLSYLLVLVAGLIGIRAYMRTQTDIETIVNYGITYLNICILCSFGVFVEITFERFLQATGRTIYSMITQLVGAITNIILDPILIFGLLGFPKMGIAGAAIATVASQVVSAVLTVRCIHGSQGMPWHLQLKNIRIERSVLLAICRIGLPGAAQSALYSISNMTIQSAINGFGTVAVAAWSVYGKIDFLFWMTVSSFGIAVTTFAGQNFGARQYDRVRRGTMTCLAMTAGTTLCISLALYPSAQLLFRLFSSDDAVVAQGVQMMHYLVPVYMTYICIEIFSGALRGCGDVRVPTIITVFAVCIMRIVWLAVALPFKHELSVVEFSYPLTWITATVLFAIYYAKGGWMQRCIAAQNAKTQG